MASALQRGNHSDKKASPQKGHEKFKINIDAISRKISKITEEMNIRQS